MWNKRVKLYISARTRDFIFTSEDWFKWLNVLVNWNVLLSFYWNALMFMTVLDISSFCLLFYTITYNLIKEDFTFKAIHRPLGAINATVLNSVSNNCDYRINKNNCDYNFFLLLSIPVSYTSCFYNWRALWCCHKMSPLITCSCQNTNKIIVTMCQTFKILYIKCLTHRLKVVILLKWGQNSDLQMFWLFSFAENSCTFLLLLF